MPFQQSAIILQPIKGVSEAIISVLAMIVSLYLLLLVTKVVRRRIRNSPHIRSGLTIRGTEILSADQVRELAADLVTLIDWALIAVTFVYLTGLFFSATPTTEEIGRSILTSLEKKSRAVGRGILVSIPNLIEILVIIFIAKIISMTFTYLMERVENGTISLSPYIPRELALPTLMIGNFLIILVTLAAIVPIIPGITSTGQILILVVGGIITLASSSTIGNVISGFVMAYMKPFNIGDAIQIGSTFGEVTEKTLLFTRILTPKNEEVLIPNLQVTSSQIDNKSAHKSGLIVYTTVSIGYNVPRKRVEELLLEGARNVELRNPEMEPFVLVQALGDNYVTYEINIYTFEPVRLLDILSQLHKHVKDSFDAAGVEILSPSYHAIRDGNKSTIPPDESTS